MQPIQAVVDKTVNAGYCLAPHECSQHKRDNHKNQRVSLVSIVLRIGQITLQKFHKIGKLLLTWGNIANHRYVYLQ